MTRKAKLLPKLAAAFAELGYRRATTALLAARCEAQETILYRIWPDKRAMFAEAIDFVADNNLRIYREVLERNAGAAAPMEALLAYEAAHIGEFRNHRIVFSALPEAGDPAIREALRRMYLRIHAFVAEAVAADPRMAATDAAAVAWGLMGIGTMATIVDELGLMSRPAREAAVHALGARLLAGNRLDSKAR